MGNDKILAIRGTEVESAPQTYLDLLQADLNDIGLFGVAFHQAVSLFNYVQRLQADAGDSQVLQLTLMEVVVPFGFPPPTELPHIAIGGLSPAGGPDPTTRYLWLEASYDGQGLGVLNEGDVVSVTGHSLGGHLAALAIRLFPDLFTEAVTFNAAGFDPVTSAALTDEFVQLFANFLPVPPAPSFENISHRIHTLESESSGPGDDLSLVASIVAGAAPSDETFIHTEVNSHSMDQLMDALAVHGLMETLNPDLNAEQIFRFYDAAWMEAGSTEERLVEALSKILLQDAGSLEPVEAGVISHGDFILRSAIHERILQILDAVEGTGVTIQEVSSLSRQELLDLAEQSIAYRYALQELNPFVILGSDDLYSAVNQDGRLDFDSFDLAYWTDRIDFLNLKFSLSLADETEQSGGIRDISYTDTASGLQLAVDGPLFDSSADSRVIFGSNDAAIFELLEGDEGKDRIHGGLGDDVLVGKAGADELFGGKGDDVLFGNSNLDSLADDGAIDVLNGGPGSDAYYVADGDSIFDVDRQVAFIDHRGVEIAGTYVLVEEGHYRNEEKNIDLVRNGDQATLILSKDGAITAFRILNFSDGGSFVSGDFGISLDDSGGGSGVPGGGTIFGTEGDDHFDAYGGGPGPVIGTIGADRILALEGDDKVLPDVGSDFVDAGPGNDLVIAFDAVLFSGRLGDWQYGGAGSDILLGHEADDRLFGGEHGDFLQGRSGDDWLYGGPGGDQIYGGVGNDRLFGNGGDDIMDGDRGAYFNFHPFWTNPGAGPAENFFYRGPLLQESPADTGTGDDWLSGGDGDDVLSGNRGDDILYGDAGSDELLGDDGNDYLNGGAGDDSLSGDTGAAALTNGGDDYLEGGPGDDILWGSGGDNVLSGGDGDDLLLNGAGAEVFIGGAGSDTYRWDRGQGQDRIIEAGQTPGDLDRIEIARGISPLDVALSRDGLDLRLSLTGSDDTLLIENWFRSDNDKVEEIRFLGGPTWDIAAVTAVLSGTGTETSDIFPGTGGDDLFNGNGGVDFLTGGAGDDTLMGGAGDDQVAGEDGNDSLSGDAGDDVLNGGAGDDTLDGGVNDGGAPFDTLEGGSGSDTYLHAGASGGRYLIRESGQGGTDIDVLQFGPGISLDELRVHGPVDEFSAPNLEMQLVTDAGDSTVLVTIADWFAPEGGKIERIEFAGGAVLSGEELEARINSPSDGHDFLFGSGEEVVLQGMAGHDEMRGFAFSNFLSGGEGHDGMHATGRLNEMSGDGGDDRLTVLSLADTAGTGPMPLNLLSGGPGNDQLTFQGYDLGAIFEFLNSGAEAPPEIDSVSFLAGEEGDDTLSAATHGRVVWIGGPGNDRIVIDQNAGIHAIVFNRGDGADVVAFQDLANPTLDLLAPDYASFGTLSLGGGIGVSDIGLRRLADDLVLDVGGGDAITLAGWFALDGGSGMPISRLQIINQASSSYAPGSPDPLEGSAVLLLDFGELLAAFELASAGQGDEFTWPIADSLVLVDAFNDQALGGQIAYEYGFHGRIDTLGLDSLLAVASRPEFLTAPQSIDLISTGDEVTVIIGTDGKDYLEGTAGSDELHGGTGRDVLDGGAGDDLLLAGSGRDRLLGGDGDDVLDGGEGRDQLLGGDGADVLDGGTGRDRLSGGEGDDVLDGGTGRDRLEGGAGNDTYVIGAGYGKDTVLDTGGVDTIRFTGDASFEDLRAMRRSDDLLLGVRRQGAMLRIEDWFSDASSQIERFEFADGSVVTGAQIQSLVQSMAAFGPRPSAGLVVPVAHAETPESYIVAADAVWHRHEGGQFT